MSFSIQSFRFTFNTKHIYMAHSHLLFPPLAGFPLHPFVSPLCSLLLTWHPPVVIGIVHLPLRLLVN